MPLFYALSQAGQAIAATSTDGPEWRYHGHGLSVRRAAQDIRLTPVKPTKADGAFQAVEARVNEIPNDTQVTPNGAGASTCQAPSGAAQSPP